MNKRIAEIAAILRAAYPPQRFTKSSPRQLVRRKTQWAILKGDLVPQACELCKIGPFDGRKRIVQAHHHDYSRPLDVQWLCRKCHQLAHR